MSRVNINTPLVLVAALGLFGLACLNHPPPQSMAVERSAVLAPAPARERLAIATYNVHMNSPAKLAAAIRADGSLREADVIFLQEINWPSGASRSNAAAIAAALSMHHAYAPGYGLRGGGSHGIAILSRYPLSELETLELPKNHTVVNSARRVALAATITTRIGEIRLWNVHLDARINPKRRMLQLAPVFDAIDRGACERVVLAGDVNTSPFCWLGSLLPIPCGLQTRRLEGEAARRGFVLPTRSAGATSRFLGMRLDAIYLRGLEALEVGVADTGVSDHLPLWAIVR